MSEQVYVGIDLGGTNIKVGLCDADGNLLQTYEGPTENDKGTETVMENIALYTRKLVEDYGCGWDQVAGIGAGIAGFMDFAEGYVKKSPNISSLNEVHVKRILEQKLNKPIRINNDANVAALGEAWGGAGKGFDNLVCFTLGTGVGGGIIVNGRILQGSGMAGELGHIAIVPDLEATRCGCGQMGCLETVSSATGVIRMAKDAVERGDRTVLAQIDQLTAKDVYDAAKSGDEVALRITNRAAFYLGKALAIVAVVVNPDRFIIGGGVARAGAILFDAVRDVFHQYTQAAAREGVEIVPAQLGNDAGIVGAAGLNLR